MAVTILKAALSGVITGLYPIGLVIMAALFTYALTVETGGITEIRKGLSHISDDKRVLALIVVWGFGTFMEGMAGFGTAVAIPVAILVGVGFDPMKAVICGLVANTTPTAYGSVGVSSLVLANETGLPIEELSPLIAQLQLLVTALGPFLILWVVDGFRGIKERFGIAILADLAFLIPWVALSYVGNELPDIIGGLTVIIAIALTGKFRELKAKTQFFAWLPFLLVIVALSVGAALPADKKITPGLLIIAATTIAGLIERLSIMRIFKLLLTTIVKYRKAVITICLILAVAKVLGVVGFISYVANALIVVTGDAYPAFAPIVGAFGGFLTGSGTSSNVLFGALQASVASDYSSKLLFAAANIMGAGIGKMICLPSIVLGAATAGISGQERVIMRRTLKYFILVIGLASLTTYVFAKL